MIEQVIEQFITANGARYFVRTAGAGSPLLMLHGFTGASDNWLNLCQSAHGGSPDPPHAHAVILPDLLGHGRTESPHEPSRYAMACAASDLVALLDALRIERAHVLGYSMGARLALYLTLAHPSRVHRLILESGSPGLETEAERETRRTQDEALAMRIQRDGIAAFVDEWERLPLWTSQRNLPDAVRRRLRAQRLRNNPVGLANSLRGMGTGAQPSLWEQLPDCRHETLLVVGALDEKFRDIDARMAGLMPHARLVVVPGAGHATHLEQPGRFVREVTEFLIG
jgi:2-succinyl-6-hydroxy-2,4-cyclohexadiene-1-carboxylate synthase